MSDTGDHAKTHAIIGAGARLRQFPEIADFPNFNLRMAATEKVYSNKIWLSMIQFIEREHGKDLADRVLAEAGLDRLELEDTSGFQPTETGIRLTETAIRLTGKPDLAYLAGRAVADSLGAIGGMILGLTSPGLAMRMISQIESKVALKTINKSEKVGKNQYRVRISFKDGFQEPFLACQNRRGSYEAFPRFFSLPYAEVQHPTCVFKGDAQCEYLITFPEYGYIALKKVALAFGLSALALAVVAAIRNQGLAAYSGLAALFGALVSFSAYKHFQAKHSLAWTLHSNEGLSKQNRDLEKNNDRITSLQRLTVDLAGTRNVQDTCDILTSALAGEFGYGSSQVWLLDADGKFLANRSAHGYDPDLRAFIRATRFEMGRDWDNPYGLLIQTMQDGKTLLVNDVDEAVSRLSPRTGEFIRALRASAFIVTPLFHDKAPIGLVTAELQNARKLDNNDRLLFQSVSNIAANSIVKHGEEDRIEDA
jgi:hypothetical protein